MALDIRTVTLQLTALSLSSLAACQRPDDLSQANGSYALTDSSLITGRDDGFACCINNAGQIAGDSLTGSFLWKHGELIELGELGSLPGGLGAWASVSDINDSGQVVGASSTSNLALHGFLWEEGEMIDLGTLGGSESYAKAVNNNRQVVGYAETNGSHQHAFLWETGEMTDLGTLPDRTDSSAHDINSSGQVVGHSYNRILPAPGIGAPVRLDAELAFLWEDGAMVAIGTFGGLRSHANAINDTGQVVGWAETADGDRHAYLWENGELIDLGTLGGMASEAYDINDAAQVVGWAETSSGDRHAFLRRGGVMIDLNGRLLSASYFGRFELREANHITNRGEIIAYAFERSAGEFDAMYADVLLTPRRAP